MNIKKNNIEKYNFYKNIYGEDKGIIELTLSDFIYKKKKLYINNDYFEKKGFIIFYAPWCQHCRKISELLIDLAMVNLNIFSFGAVNSENIKDGNDKLCNYANIQKLPTIFYINDDNSLTEYKHSYNSDNLIYYINTNI